MGMASYKHNFGQTITTDVADLSADRAFIAHVTIAAAKATTVDTDGIFDGIVAEDGTAEPAGETVIVTPATPTIFKGQPSCPRNITATVAATTPGHVKAAAIKITGKNIAGETISEELTPTADTPATLTGTKAFASITSVEVPAQDGDSVTVDIGFGKSFGLPYLIAADEQAVVKLFDGVVDAGTVANSATDIEANTFTPAGTPDGLKDIGLYIIV